MSKVTVQDARKKLKELKNYDLQLSQAGQLPNPAGPNKPPLIQIRAQLTSFEHVVANDGKPGAKTNQVATALAANEDMRKAVDEALVEVVQNAGLFVEEDK